jgi:hypothetical protein
MKKEAKSERDYSAELILHNAMMFAMFDMAEAEMIDVENEASKMGLTMQHEVKRIWNKIKHCLQLLRGYTRSCPLHEQEAIGNSSELYRLFIWRLVSICSADKKRYFYVYNAIKNMYKADALIDLTNDEKDVFATLMDLEQ